MWALIWYEKEIPGVRGSCFGFRDEKEARDFAAELQRREWIDIYEVIFIETTPGSLMLERKNAHGCNDAPCERCDW